MGFYKNMFEDKFYQMLQQHTALIHDPRKFKGILSDYFPQRDWKKNLILELYQLGIMEEIDNAASLDIIAFHHFIISLEQAYGTQSKNAEWAVNTWLKYYGKLILNKTLVFNDSQKIEQNEDELVSIEEDEWSLNDTENSNKQWEVDNDSNDSKIESMICTIERLLENTVSWRDEEIDYALNIVAIGHRYRKVLHYFPRLCVALNRNGVAEEKISDAIGVGILDSKNVYDYSAYKNLFNKLLAMHWKIDYYIYGIAIFTPGIYLHRKYDEHMAWKWIAYFHEKLVEKKLENLNTIRKGVNYSVDNLETVLGFLYASGVYIEKNMEKASQCFMTVLQRPDKERSNLSASGQYLYYIGSAYLGNEATMHCGEKSFSVNIEKDLPKAINFLTKAVEYENSSAMYYLATLYEKGEFLPKDMRYASNLYEKSANLGDEEAAEWIAARKENYITRLINTLKARKERIEEGE